MKNLLNTPIQELCSSTSFIPNLDPSESISENLNRIMGNDGCSKMIAMLQSEMQDHIDDSHSNPSPKLRLKIEGFNSLIGLLYVLKEIENIKQ